MLVREILVALWSFLEALLMILLLYLGLSALEKDVQDVENLVFMQEFHSSFVGLKDT